MSANCSRNISPHSPKIAATRCIVLTGGDKMFAAGADIRELADATTVEVYLRNTQRLWRAIAQCPKPIVAAVNGFAFGAGCELAMHADIIIAGENRVVCPT